MTDAPTPAQNDTDSSPWRRGLAMARSVPATLIVAGVVLIAGIVSGALWTPAEESGLIDTWGWGLESFQEGRWWTILGGTLISPTPWMYPLILILFIGGAGYLEARFGWLKMLVVTFGTHVVAVATAAALFWALSGTSVPWASEYAEIADVGLSNAAFGAVGAVSAAMPLLWRRRLRLGLLMYLVAMLLWAGEVWDFTHLLAFLTGLAVGPWVAGRAFERVDWRLGGQETRDLAALLVVFSALHTILSHVWPGEGGILSFGNPEVSETTLLGDIGIAILQLVVAYALHKGSRFAWWVVTAAVALTSAAGMLVMVVEPSWSIAVGLILDLALLVTLLLGRRHFAVRAAPGDRGRIWRRIGLATVATVVFTSTAIMALGSSFDHQPTWGEAIGTSFMRILGDSEDGLQPETTATRVLLSVIGVVWYVVIAASIAGLLLSSRRPVAEQGDRERFIELQDQAGMTSIGYMARWDGITHWVSSSRDVAIGYRLEGGTAVVLGDPAGAPAAVDAAIEEFRDWCRSHGWRAAYFAASPDFRDQLEAHDYGSLQVAEDTVIHLPELEFKGKAWQDVRSAINRAKRESVTMRTVHLHEAPRGMKDQLEAISAQWAGDKSLPELGFTLGGLEEAADPNVIMHVAVDEDGTVHGMTSWMPVYRDGDVVGWTIDIMKRRLDDGVMSGVMEFLIASSALEFKEAGYQFISLSCAPLSYSGEVESSVERMLDILADRMEPYYGFASLERFKAKFKPEHVPMYLCYRDEAQLPAVTLAILRAYLPDASAADLIKAAARPGD